MYGAVAQARGKVHTAARLFGEALAASVPTFTLPVDLPGALGSLREAVALSRQAAQVAASQHQPAVEVVALHTAVCFGDRTLAGRLAELAGKVGGPRAPPRPRTPPRWPPTTAPRCMPHRCNSRRWARCCWPPTPLRSPSPHTPAMVSGVPPTPPAAARTGWRKLARARAPPRWPRWPAAATHRAGARDRHLGRWGIVQPADRRAAGRVGPYRRGPPLPGLCQARRLRP
jgi:hypothetical protein